MYKRHGTIVRQVLAEQVALNSAKLIDRDLEQTSLLALAIGQKYLPAREDIGRAGSDEGCLEKNSFSGTQSLILTKLDDVLRAFEASVGIPAQPRKPKERPSFPTRRDTILFAAIVRDLKGLKYCSFLDNHRVKTKWSENGPKNYRESYLASGSYRKKVQDEKTRAKCRMSKHPASVLMDAFVTYFRSDEFDELRSYVNSRNSHTASKKFPPSTGA